MTSTAEKIASGQLQLTNQRIIVQDHRVTARTVMNETWTQGVAKFRDNVIMNKDLTIDGTLIVQGPTTTTSVAITNSTIENNLIMLNKGVESDINDSGILIERVGKNGFMGWDELHDTFVIGLTDATDKSTGNLTVTPTALTVGNFVANGDADVTGELTVKGNFIHTGILNTLSGIFPTSIGTEGQVLTAGTDGVMEWAQSTSTGSGTSGSGDLLVDGDANVTGDLTVDGDAEVTGGLTVDGHIIPKSHNNYTLGSSTTRYAHAYFGPSSCSAANTINTYETVYGWNTITGGSIVPATSTDAAYCSGDYADESSAGTLDIEYFNVQINTGTSGQLTCWDLEVNNIGCFETGLVVGEGDLVSTFNVYGSTTLTGALTVTSDATLNADLTVSGDASISGNLTVSGTTTTVDTVNTVVKDSVIELGSGESSSSDTGILMTTDGDNLFMGWNAGNGQFELGYTANGSTDPTFTISTYADLKVGSLDAGATTLASMSTSAATISGGTVNNTPLGGTTPATGDFTTLSSSGLATLNSMTTGTATISGGTVDGTPLGGTTAADGKFTTLSTSGLATLNSMTTATATISGGTVDGTPLGGTTAADGKFTTLSTSGLATLNSMTTATATISGGTVNNTPLGGTTAADGKFTTLSTSGLATLDSTTVTNALTAGSMSTAGTLTAGATTLTSAIVNDTLDVTGEADFDASLCIAGNLDIGLEVSATDASFNDTLNVGGEVEFDASLCIAGNLDIGLEVSATDASFNDTLNVGGEVEFDASLCIAGNLDIGLEVSATDASFNDTLNVGGEVEFDASLCIAGNLDIGLEVSATDASFNDTLNVGGEVEFDANLCIAGNLILGGDLTGVGINDLDDCLVEDNSVYIGNDPNGTTDDAEYNVAVGATALDAITTGDKNVAIGYNALTANKAGSKNTAIGFESLKNNMIGQNNTAVGRNSLSLNTGGNNTGIGRQAGNVIVSGSDNVCIGDRADVSDSDANNRIVIGVATTGQANNTVTLGNSSVDAVYMSEDSGAKVYCGDVDATNGDFSGTLDVTGEADFDASLCIAGNLDIGLDASFNGMLDVGGDAFFDASLCIAGNVDVLGTLTADDGSFNTLYVDGLSVSGSTITVGLSATISEGSTTGNIEFNGDLELGSGKKIKIDGSDLSLSHLDGVSGTTTADLNALYGFAAATSNSTVKAYVDSVATGLDVKGSVRLATTEAGTLTTDYANTQTIDGVALVTNDRILIKDQTTATENGIYTVNATGAPTRATDMDSSVSPAVSGGLFTFVEEGASNADTGWVLTNNGTVVLDTDALTFSKFSSGGSSNSIEDILYTIAIDKSYTVLTKVVAATTGNLSLASDFEDGDQIDGVTLATGDRILIKDQTTATENGIYDVTAGTPTRVTDLVTNDTAQNKYVFVEQGTDNADKGFVCLNTTSTVDTDDLTFTELTSTSTLLNQLSLVDVDSNSMYLGSDPSVTKNNALKNVSIGINALNVITTGDTNVAIGYDALTAANSAISNTAIGNDSMIALTTGQNNVAVGQGSMYTATAAYWNAAVGQASLYNVTGNDNSAIGMQSLYNCAEGIRNCGVGRESGKNLTTGDYNIAIGYLTNFSAAGVDKEIVIGQSATGQGTNTVTLGNGEITAVYMAQDSTATVHCAGVTGEAGVDVTGDGTASDATDIAISAAIGGGSIGEVNGEGAAGAGGDITITGGAGGERSVFDGGGGAGGNITLTAGSAGTDVGVVMGPIGHGSITLTAPGNITNEFGGDKTYTIRNNNTDLNIVLTDDDANGGVGDTIVMTNTDGTAPGAIAFTATAGGIDINAGGAVDIDAGAGVSIDAGAASNFSTTTGAANTPSGALSLTSGVGGANAADGGAPAGAGGALNITTGDGGDSAQAAQAAGAGGDIVIAAGDGGTNSVDAADGAGGNIAITAGGGDIDTTRGAVTVTSSKNDAAAIALSATEGGITAKVADENDLTMGNAAGDAYFKVAASATPANEDVRIVNTNGTDAAAIAITATAGGIDVNAAKTISLDTTTGAANTPSGALSLTSGVGGANAADGGAPAGAGGALNITTGDGGDSAQAAQAAGAGGDIVIAAGDGGTNSVDAADGAGGNIAITAGGGDIDTTRGAVTVTSSKNDAAAIALSATEGGITAKVADENDLTMGNAAGDAYFKVAASATPANEDVRIVNTNGTDAAAIAITATAGGIDVNAAKTISLDTTTGAANTPSGALSLTSGVGGANAADGGAPAGAGGALNITTGDGGDSAQAAQAAGAGGDIVIAAGDGGTNSVDAADGAGGNIAITAGGGDIDTTRGAVTVTSSKNDAAAIALSATEGGITAKVADENDLTMGNAAGDAYFKVAASATPANEDVRIVNTNGTDAAAIAITATAGGIDVNAAKTISLDTTTGAANTPSGALSLTSGVGGANAADGGAPAGAGGALNITTGDGGDSAQAAQAAGAGGDIVIAAGDGGTNSVDAADGAGGNIAITAGGGDIDTTRGAVTVTSSKNDAAAIALSATEGGITAKVADENDLTMGNAAGDAYFKVAASATPANEDVRIVNTNGTDAAAIAITATAGGIDVNAAKTISLDTTTGAANTPSGALSLTSGVGGANAADGGAPAGAGGALNITTGDGGDSAQAAQAAGAGGDIVIAAGDGGTNSVDAADGAGGNIAITAGGGDIDTTRGAVTVTSSKNDAAAIALSATEGGITAKVADENDLTMGNAAGDAYFKVAASATPANEDVRIVNTNGTDAAAIAITATAGGIDVNAAKTISLDTTTGAANTPSGALSLTSGVGGANAADGGAPAGAGGALNITTGNGGDSAQAAQAAGAGGDIVIAAGDGGTNSVDAADGAGGNIAITAGGGDIDTTRGAVTVTSSKNDAAAIALSATAGGIDVNGGTGVTIDSAANDIDITAAVGNVGITGAQNVNIAATAAEIDLTAGTLVDINAGGTISMRTDTGDNGASSGNNGDDAADIILFAGIGGNANTTGNGGAGGDISLISSIGGNGGSGGGDVNGAGGTITLSAAGGIAMTATDGTVAITADGTDDHVLIKGDNESALAIHLDGNAAAASIVKIDAGVLEMNASAGVTIDAGAAITLSAAGGIIGTRTVLSSSVSWTAGHVIQSGALTVPTGSLITNLVVIVTILITGHTDDCGIMVGTNTSGSEREDIVNATNHKAALATGSADVSQYTGTAIDTKMKGALQGQTDIVISVGKAYWAAEQAVHMAVTSGGISGNGSAFSAGSVKFLLEYIKF